MAPSSSSPKNNSGSTGADMGGKNRDRYVAPTPSPNIMATLWPTPKDTYSRVSPEEIIVMNPSSSSPKTSSESTEVDMLTRNRYITPTPSPNIMRTTLWPTPKDTYLQMMRERRPVG